MSYLENEIGITHREPRISGEVREEEGSTALRLQTGRFHPHTSLPSDVDENEVQASMGDAVLTSHPSRPTNGRDGGYTASGAR